MAFSYIKGALHGQTLVAFISKMNKRIWREAALTVKSSVLEMRR